MNSSGGISEQNETAALYPLYLNYTYKTGFSPDNQDWMEKLVLLENLKPAETRKGKKGDFFKTFH